MTAPVSITVRKSPSWTYSLLAGFQVLDVLTTWWILGFLGGSEANPIVDAFINGVGLPASMLSLLAFKLTIVYLLWRKGSGVRFISAIYGAVIFNNLLFLLVRITM